MSDSSGPPSASSVPLSPKTLSSLAGGLLTDAVNKLQPGQSLKAEVKLHEDRRQGVKVEVDVRDDRGAKFYEVVVTLGP